MCTIRPYRRACIWGRMARPSRTGLLTKKFSWARWPAQPTSATRASGWGAGGVEHQHINRAEPAGDRGDQFGDPLLIGDVGGEGPRYAAGGTYGAADLFGLLVAALRIDRDREAVLGQPARDLGAEPPRAARHQGHTPVCHRHVAIIPPRSGRGPPGAALVISADACGFGGLGGG